jgi:predicted MFS family arabinose efflux permease
MATPETAPIATPAAGTTQLSARPQLLLLALANFAVGMGAFVVIGILSPVAADLGISKAQAASLLTGYALVYAISSPLLVALTGGLDRRLALALGMAVFGLGAPGAALSSGLVAVLAARAVMALGAGIVTPVAATVGVALAGAEHRGRALAIVFGGLTLAQALGVPLGAWIGYAYGWRLAFGLVAALAAGSAVAITFSLPSGVKVAMASLASLKAVLTSLSQTVAVSFTALFIGALYVLYTFLAALVEARYQLGRDGVTAMLGVFGVGAVVGNSVGGVLTDSIGPQRTLLLLCTAQLVLLPALSLLPLGLWAFGALVALWSVCSWSFMVPQQARLALLAPARIPVLFALNAAAIYVGSSAGSALGGLTLRAEGFTWLGPVGAALALLALASLRWQASPRAG